MTEQEYIDTSDLARIRAARAALSSLCQPNQPACHEAEYEVVMRTLAAWEGRLEQVVGEHLDEAPPEPRPGTVLA